MDQGGNRAPPHHGEDQLGGNLRRSDVRHGGFDARFPQRLLESRRRHGASDIRRREGLAHKREHRLCEDEIQPRGWFTQIWLTNGRHAKLHTTPTRRLHGVHVRGSRLRALDGQLVVDAEALLGGRDVRSKRYYTRCI
jgi:hypothetical protein